MARGACLATTTPVSTRLPTTVRLLTTLLLLLLPHLVITAQVPRYEFEVKLYDKPVPWQKCPEGWRKQGKKCYKVFFHVVSWEDASKVCKSVGGGLAEVEGFNQNQGLGRLLEEAVSAHRSQQPPPLPTSGHGATGDPPTVWIGLKRDRGGDYSWASGSPAFKQQGFWDIGNPPTLSSSNNVHEQCCDISLDATALGRFRWRLGECDKKRVFVCETKVCNEHHFRCADGRQCVSEQSVCDGILDCEDGSDERQCKEGESCGGSLAGEQGTFHSPGYPKKYPTKVTCVWQLHTPVGTRVQLKFESFDVERKYDSVEVYDGSEREPSALVGRYSGTSVPLVPFATSHVLLVILSSDGSIEAQGFNASWSAVMFDGPSGTCGGELVAQSSVQWFTSPLFPSPYPHNLVCDWVITSSSGTDIVTLQFQDFDVEEESDWVEVYNGPTDSDALFGRFSGSGLPRVIISTAPSLFVRFRSNSKHSRKGFNTTYSSGCDVDIVSGYATIGSPGYGVKNYPVDVACSWTISDPLHRRLNLIFNPTFDTEAAVDIVQVYNSSQVSPAHLAGEFSGTATPSPIHSTTGAYVLRFSSDSSVQRPGWSASVSFDCNPLGHQEPMEISASSVTFGTVVHFGCREGYRLNGARSTLCDMRGLWNPDVLPTCQLMDCGSPTIPKNGYLVSLSGMTFGHVATYRCRKGYYLHGANTSSCQMDGWSPLPKCKEIYCPKQPPPPHGSAMAEDNTFGAQREFFCNDGYQLVGAKFSYCTAEGVWTSPVPQCRLLQCGGVAGIIHGQSAPAGPVQVGQQVDITCDWGYQLSGHSPLTCRPTLDYDHPIPFCTDINECELDGVCAGDGHHRCQNLEGSYRCVCDPGYQHSSPDQQTVCQDIDECARENGGCNQLCNNLLGSYECSCRSGYTLYTGDLIVINGGQLVPNKSCIAPCKPLVIAHGRVAYTSPPLHDGTYLHPTEAIVVCPASYVPNGPSRLHCRQEGGWSGTVTTCQVSVCPLLDVPMNGQVAFSRQTLGSNATYTCEEGFHLQGPKYRFCQLHTDLNTQQQALSWSGPQPACLAVDCGQPPEPANGVVSYIRTTFQSVATYSCLCGFQLEGDSIRRCQSNGLWSGNSTHCVVQRCRRPGQPKYGSMVGSHAAYPVGSVVRFHCDRPGYQLSDPWPMECLSGPSFQVSPVLPVYRFSVRVSFMSGDYTDITEPCGVYYQGEVIRLLGDFAPRLQNVCAEFGQPRIAVDNNTMLNITQLIIRVTGWYEVWTEEKEGLPSACQCGQAISDTLSDFIASSSLIMLAASQELGCPPVFLQRESVNTSDHRWSCPHGLGLMNDHLQCGQGLPACTQECVSELPSTATPSYTITTPSPHQPTSSTTTITLPTPPPPTSIPSTTSTSATSTTSLSSSSETGGQTPTTQSTIKNIMTGSTTASSPSESSDSTSTSSTVAGTTVHPVGTTSSESSSSLASTSTEPGTGISRTTAEETPNTDTASLPYISTSDTNAGTSETFPFSIASTQDSSTLQARSEAPETSTRPHVDTTASESDYSDQSSTQNDTYTTSSEVTAFTTERPLTTVTAAVSSPDVTTAVQDSTLHTSQTSVTSTGGPVTTLRPYSTDTAQTTSEQTQATTPAPHTTPAQHTTPAPQTPAPHTTPAPQTPAPLTTPASQTPAPQTLAPLTTPAPQTPAPQTPAPHTTPAPQTPAPHTTPAPQTPAAHTTPVPQTPAPQTPPPHTTPVPHTTPHTSPIPQSPAPTTTPAPQTPALHTTPAPQTPAPHTTPAPQTPTPHTTLVPHTTPGPDTTPAPNTTPAPQTPAPQTLAPKTTPAPQTSPPQTPAPQTPAPQTPAPQTPAPKTTPAPQTPAPQTPSPQTPAPKTTLAPQTLAPQTPAPQTPAPQTPAPQTPAPQTPAPQTPAPQTLGPKTTRAPQTPTPAPETPAPQTPAPQTPAPQTPAPQKPAPQTPTPQTPAPKTTPAPQTPAPQTPAPQTPAPQTPAPQTPAPQTPAPQTPAPQTLAPKTTPAPQTPAPQTPAPQTPAPQTPGPQTPGPQTQAPQTPAPQTPAPQTPAPKTTPAPQTPAPQTLAPQTPAPQTPAPQTLAPQTPAPKTTPAPQTPAPQTPAPQTPAPQTPAPQTPAPQTLAPQTLAPKTTLAPQTPAPQTPAPQTPAPKTTPAPVTQLPIEARQAWFKTQSPQTTPTQPTSTTVTSVPWLDRGTSLNDNMNKTSAVIKEPEYTTLPSGYLDIAMPLFVMEVEDKMEGSFTNITCIDEVHVNINSKVNKLMRDFNADIGNNACLNGSDITVELLSGNIRFKGTQATIFIQFSLKFRSSPADSVEQCALEFQAMVLRLLPSKLEQVGQQVKPDFCQQASYTPGHINVSRSLWDCPKGYQLDPAIFVCQRTITTPFSSLAAATPTPSATMPPVPVQSIPRVTLTFRATFTSVANKGRPELEACLAEYDAGLNSLLADLEPYLQNYNSNCSNIFVDITANLSVTVLHANQLRVMVDVKLLPLANTVHRSSLTGCAAFLTSVFSNPSKVLPNVTVPAIYTLNCSSIQLTPPSLAPVADPAFYCDEGFFYEEYNFLCLDESLPSFTVEIHLTILLAAAPQQDCRKALESSATSLSQAVMEDVHSQLMSGSLCNASTVGERVVPLLHNSQLSVVDTEVIISIPFVLLSLTGKSDPVSECKAHLYSYLSASLGDPVNGLMSEVNVSCSVVSWPRTFSQAAEKWGCFEGRVYNAQTHSCDHYGALEESITKTKGLMSERRRRDAHRGNEDTTPFWNATLPVCQDHEPPVFNGCPKTSVQLPLGQAGPLPMTIDVPSVSDNSGGALIVTYQPPDFRPHVPYIFRQNTIVNITAVDTAGNKAVCRISVFLLDITPPSIHCLKKLHQHHFDTNGNRVQVVYPDGLITALDYGGVASITFDPSPGTTIEVMKKVNVTATVVDRSGNAASCSFLYLATNDRCPLWELPTPAQGQGQRTCTSEIQGSVGFGVSCQVACPHGYQFVTPPPPQYVCVNGSVWHPNNSVPHCGALSYSNFDFNMTLNFTYDGANSNNYCLELVSSSVLSQITPFFNNICVQSANFIDIKIEHMGFFDPQGRHFFVLKMKVSISLRGGARKAWASQCGSLILAQMDNLTSRIPVSDCGNVSFLPPSDAQGQNSCSAGSILVEEFCLECPAGTYHNSSTKQCEVCPQGQYQGNKGQGTCDLCPEGTSTADTGATTLSDCLGLCPAGSYSPSGLQPCERCERGQYQADRGRTVCMPCPDGQSTASVAATSSRECLELCPVGYYSSTGVVPCYPCPLHHYSNERGATLCTECSPYQVTNATASPSSDSCVVVPWCEPNMCGAGSTCVNQHRFAQCLCAPGFTGERCEVNVDECASQPCVHGGTCEDGVNSFTCHCRPGYEGTSCEVETDECSPDPCVHGQCLDAHLSYFCHCLQGYTGDRCEMNINDCVNDPCQNGGQCVDLVEDFRCDCSGTGYEGVTCQNDIDDCYNSSCLNSGTCHDRVNGFDCSCVPGFTGAMCETDIDECRAYPCSNNAVCIDQVNSFSCVCQPGYTGEQCELDINECASSPCVNGGICTDLVSDYLCTCQRGYEGKNCQVDVDECASSPCDLNGTERCEDGINTFTCHCLPLWKGERCDSPADPCSSSPCMKGATCTVAGDTFVCLCPPDFTGTLCDHHIDDCESGPCMNNGTCHDGVHSFSCQCIPGLTGTDCDVNVDECTSQPCAYGATCLDLIDGFTCRCASGYAGELCEKNIDDCASQPCAHGGTCRDLVDRFKCLCPPGYMGKTCTKDVNECDNSPCRNGAACVNLQGHFQCQCPPGYSGDLCQLDLCMTNNSCLNSATCMVQSGAIICRCPPQFSGVDCGKEKTGDYDLLFRGKTGSACKPPDVLVPSNAHLAVCLWLRYASPDASGTVLTLSRSSMDRDDQQMDDSILLDLTGGVISVSLEGEREPRRFSVAVTDGRWHHVCYQWLGPRHAVYVDGVKTLEEKYGAEVSLSDRLKLVLGHPHQHTQPAKPFQGEISQANLFSSALDNSQIRNMALNCSNPQPRGDLFAWLHADAYLEGEVTVVMPAICGRSRCPPGFHGTFCSLQTDKIAPRVVFCPSDQSVTKNVAMVTVTWPEPVFEDNVAIVRIQQTHRSGQAFHQGEYRVTYVAYDAENNSAQCSFAVIVKPFDCVEPPPPKHGAKVCQTWLHGSYCSVECPPPYSYLELPPTFYSCGQLGFWDPPLGSPFRFPECALTTDLKASLVGIVDVQGPGCTEAFQVYLKSRFTRIMTELDRLLGLCLEKVCDFENGFSVVCDEEGAGRRKRDASSLYRVAIHLDLPSNSSAVQKTNGQWAAEEIITAIKRGQFDDSQFRADPSASHLSMDFICEPGQVLRLRGIGNISRICLDCPEGYYYNSSVDDCRVCEEGSYSTEPRQFRCQPCPPGTTTAALGSTSPDACFELCSSGSFYDPSSKKCQPCPRGQYQGGTGQTSCLFCPEGQSTEQPGATTIEQCANVCALGQEISGEGQCQPCPRGSYQDSRDTPVCQPCPYGWTTPSVGTTALQDCSVVVCERGHRWLPDNRCEPCPVGTYQPARGSNHCTPCGAGLTTADPGTVSRAQCHVGPVDECKLQTHRCDEHASCVDTEQDYYCVCQSGFTGDGINCTDLCEDYCENDGVCDYGVDGGPFCNCKNGFTGDRCQEDDLVSAGLSSAVAGGIAGSVVAVVVIIIVAVACYWRHRVQKKKSHDRIYRSRKGMTPAAFYNEGYESVRDSVSTPSQLIVREQSSSTSSSSTLSMAPRWNRSTFANSDEDEMDACWFESFHMDDLSLGSDAFTRTAHLEAESYF